MGFEELFDCERARYRDGEARPDPGQLVRMGNAAYGAGLSLLMLGRGEEAAEWLERAAARWYESWEHATPTSWGRPIGAIKASVIAARTEDAARFASWALELEAEQAPSPIGRYAATLALLVLGRDAEAAVSAKSLRGSDEFPADVAEALMQIAAHDAAAYAVAAGEVLRSFEERDSYLEDVPVADTVIVLQALAARRGLAGALSSPLLPE